MAADTISSELAEARKRKMDDRTLAQHAADMASELQAAALKCLNSDERTLLAALSRLVSEKRNRLFIRALCSRVFHSSDLTTQSAQLRQLIAQYDGIPNLFSTMGKLRLKAAAMAAGSMQAAAMKEVRRVFKSTFGELTLPPELDKINRKIKSLTKEGLVPVINPLGPDVYGKKSAEKYMRNLESILSKQQDAGVEIQPWRLCPMLSVYAPEQGAQALASDFKKLLSLAQGAGQPPASGKKKRLYIRAGNCLTLPIVIEALKLSLAPKEYNTADVILELPAYLSSSQNQLAELIRWSKARCAKNAAPLKVALLKGARLAEEQNLAYTLDSEDELCRSKLETDTRFKQLIHQAFKDGKDSIVPLVGTHNYFDLSYALLDWARCGHSGLPALMLQAGLGNHTGRMLARKGADVTLSISALAEGGDSEFEVFLLTLLNDLSRPDGILTSGYSVAPDSMGWGRMRKQFLASMSGREDAGRATRQTGTFPSSSLHCIKDRSHIDALYHEAREEHERKQDTLPLLVNGKPYDSPFTCIHRSLTVPGLAEYRFTVVDYEAIDLIMQQALNATIAEPLPYEERCQMVLRLASELEKQREKLAGIMARDAGFTMQDADIELRNAIDYCRYYVDNSDLDGLQDGTQATALGVVTVIPSAAHPVEEAIGGIAAAWITGNVVVYKPSMHSTLLGYRLVEMLRGLGFSEPRLQFVPCMDNQMASKLMNDRRVAASISSISEEALVRTGTAAGNRRLLSAMAGQTVVYLAPQCDWRQAVRDIPAAAFARSGQDASCPRIIAIHASLYDNQHFMNALKDAVSTCTAQPGWVPGAQLGPLAHALSPEALQALSGQELEGAWLVQPHPAEIASLLWTPGVRSSVITKGNFLSKAHELPILSLIRVPDTVQAAKLQNKLSRGQAAIIYTLNRDELALWRKHIIAGNIGINCCPKGQPGRIPYGGWGASSWGSVPKAGGPNFLLALSKWSETGRPQKRGNQRNMPFAPWESLSPKPSPDDFTRLTAAADSISYWWEQEFGCAHLLDPKPGETTELVYRPVPLCLRLEKQGSDIDLSIMLMAALRAGCDVQVSCDEARPWMLRVLAPLGVILREESRGAYEARFAELALNGVHVRDIAATPETLNLAAEHRLPVCTADVVANGRIELLNCLREQVITHRTARNGCLNDETE